MMDQGSKLILDLILAKDAGQVTEEDKLFLRARRSYVQEGDFKRLVMDNEGAGETAPEQAIASVEAQENTSVADVADGPAPESTPEASESQAPATTSKPVAKMSKEELLAEAANRKIEVPAGTTNAQLKALLKK